MKVIPLLLVLVTVTGTAWGQNFMSEAREDMFSATSKLEDLLSLEAEIVRMVERYLENTQERISTIKQYVSEYRRLNPGGSEAGGSEMAASASATSQSKVIVAHPVDAFLLLKRLTVEWGSVEDAMNRHANATQELVGRVVVFRERSTFPVMEDLHGAAVALVRLQDTYNLNMTSLPSGTFTGVGLTHDEFHSSKPLSARDCLFLGKHAFNKGYYDKAIEWFEAALDKAGHEEDSTVLKQEIEPFLKATMVVHDDVLEKRGPRGTDWQTKAVPVDQSLASKHKYRGASTHKFLPKLYQQQSEEEEHDHYTRLCRGESLRPAEIESSLVCRIVTSPPAHIPAHTHAHGYFKLMPLLLEEMSLDPYIVVFHDFLTQRQTDAIIDQAKPKLATSRHRGPDGGFISSMVRTSKNAWLRENQERADLLANLTKKVEVATGLHATQPSSGEDYQVANYGIGGLYVTHTDYLMIHPDPATYSPWEHFIGDRFATFMVYLSDVEAGGATVFPRAGVTIWPKRGSAAFWWNLYRSGVGDENTRHGGCPVLHGSKWICNKWVHYNDQFRQHTCGLNTWDKLVCP
ncbi:prolyl 4-hydroxylase subunit alpha-2-like [Homarus americanus]|uniref:prolyl 4-hydroxylase subunit alpha-2-like n=1 Tax=Homarus americanus TaxID=6706 RepID=UPI001C494EA2|nr:prolyl 4-hydroxylase subunit alpha-2-like [Homarus americanus]